MILVSILFSTFLLIQPANAQVTCGDIITENTVLTQDLLNCPNNGIEIGANNIILDCNGYKISGIGSLYNSGIYVNSYDNITIKNCNVELFQFGITLYPSQNSTIENSNINITEVGTYQRSISLAGSNNNNIRNNLLYGNVEMASSNSNSFDNNSLTPQPGANGLDIDGNENIIRNNILRGIGGEVGLNIPTNSKDNIIDNNTIEQFAVGIELGGVGEGNERNIITNNTIIDNTAVGITIVRGDLNEISRNKVDSSLTPSGLDYLIKKGLIKEDSTLPIEEIGFHLEGSYNNLIWENDVYDFDNDYDEGANLYCFNGIANEYYVGDELIFDGTIINETLCQVYDCASIPACNETLNDDGPFGGGGGLLTGDGWTPFDDPNAEGGSAQYSRPNNGDQFSWHVHTLPNTFDVYVWKFETSNVPGALASNAKYEIRHSLGRITKTVDWTTPGNEWIYLGRYTFRDDPDQGVYLSDNADGIVVADAVRIENIGPPWQNVRNVVEKKIGPILEPFSI